MSNELELFKGVENLPTYDDADLGAVEVGSVSGIPRISIKGAVFTVIEGQEKKEIGKNFIAVIIKSSGIKDDNDIPADSHRYYKTAYTGEDGVAPDCASINGIKPDSTIENPECALCKDCLHMVWGSKKGRMGGKARECGDYRRLAVGVFKDTDGSEIDVYQLDIPATSLINIKKYSEFLRKKIPNKKLPLDSVFTNIQITSPEGYPVLTFEPVKGLNEVQYAEIRKLRNSELVKTITTREVAPAEADEPPQAKKEVTPEPVAKVKVDNSDDVKAKIDKALEGE